MRLAKTLLFCIAPVLAADLDLSKAVVVVRQREVQPAEKTAATVLVEEVYKRTGIRMNTATRRAEGAPSIVIGSTAAGRPEGYRVRVAAGALEVDIEGADARGTLFGVGYLLRKAEMAAGKFTIDSATDVTTAPMYPIRGHQLGYRPQANSYDAWDAAQFEQYIRELAFFGANSVEGIPFHDDRTSAVMKVPRREINRAISEICNRYGLDYWVWVPADFDLKDAKRRAAFLVRHEEMFRDAKEMTGVFFPGGDPGTNPPEQFLPYLEDLAKVMTPLHPKAKIWISLQQFSPAQQSAVYRYITEKSPRWLGGLVAGPSSPPVGETRLRLPKQYQLRLYPDLTHNKICQYQVPSWDQAYARTLGREAINPRPAEFALIHNWFAPYSDGFISYSDGVHDDVNKAIWSALAWDPEANVRDVLMDYSRVYFSSNVAEPAADGILALEKNWRGPVADNGAVEATLGRWREMEKGAPQLADNWRWQMCLLRANYDAQVRRRLIRETKLEDEANGILADAGRLGADRAMDGALKVLHRGAADPLRTRIEDLCERLFHSIGLQTSVPKYFASGEERGAVLDFVDVPLNNRWWLEDEFTKLRGLGSEAAKVQRLRQIAFWEHPGPGSFYDNVGNMAKSPHVYRSDIEVFEPGADLKPDPTFWWWNEGKSRARVTWQATEWPRAMVYEGLDPQASYVVRTSGYGQCLLRINGERLQPTVDGKEMGEFKEFAVPQHMLKDAKLSLTFDRVTNEGHLNWRQHSRLAEVWLLKK